MELQEALRELATARQNSALARRMVAEAEDALHATPEWLAYERARMGASIAGTAEIDAYERARDIALDSFRATGDKNPVAGVGIKLYKRVRYEAAEALAWCKTHAPVFVMEVLDAKAFEKAVGQMTMADAPWTIEYEPRATIASDLSDYLHGPL